MGYLWNSRNQLAINSVSLWILISSGSRVYVSRDLRPIGFELAGWIERLASRLSVKVIVDWLRFAQKFFLRRIEFSYSRSLPLIWNRGTGRSSNNKTYITCLVSTTQPASVPAAYSSPLNSLWEVRNSLLLAKSILPSAHLLIVENLLFEIIAMPSQHLLILHSIEIIIISALIVFISSVLIIIGCLWYLYSGGTDFVPRGFALASCKVLICSYFELKHMFRFVGRYLLFRIHFCSWIF